MSEGRNPDAGPEGVRVWRGGEIESRHRVHAAVADAAGGDIAHRGDPALRTYLRSAAKPVQLLPLVEEGLIDRYGLSSEEVAVMAASHSGEPFHVAAVLRILEKAGLDPGLLQCGPQAPLHEPTAAALRAEGGSPAPIHNNCSGKHAGMLIVCRALGWPLDTYREPDHPLQERIAARVAELAGLEAGAIGRGVDGCGVPTFALPVRSMAVIYARLAGCDQSRDSDRARAVGIVFDAMAAHPEYVAGTGRLCTDLMLQAGKRIIVKTGADGVYCVALRGLGQGLALKIEDGARRAQDVAVLALLGELGVVDPGESHLAAHARPEVANRSGAVVGRIDARLPLARS